MQRAQFGNFCHAATEPATLLAAIQCCCIHANCHSLAVDAAAYCLAEQTCCRRKPSLLRALIGAFGGPYYALGVLKVRMAVLESPAACMSVRGDCSNAVCRHACVVGHPGVFHTVAQVKTRNMLCMVCLQLPNVPSSTSGTTTSAVARRLACICTAQVILSTALSLHVPMLLLQH
jgi:hypothetical protein